VTELGRTNAADMLDELLARFEQMPPAMRKEMQDLVEEATGHMPWVPNVGPQTDAWNCKADQVLYGGAAGGGKTEILLNKAWQHHKRSLILRRLNAEVDYLSERLEDIVGHRTGFNGQKNRWIHEHRTIQFGGCQYAGDERKYKGQPKDFIGIDEASEFLESQVEFVSGWLRTADPKQQVQLILATNPPTTAEGEWVIEWFAPWLDPEHELYPWPQGALLYFHRDRDRKFHFSSEPYTVEGAHGKQVRALSRTFIQSFLADNPEYDRSDYAAQLASLPEALRKRYERGEFIGEPEDDEFQVIPTLWVMEAQDRWKNGNWSPDNPPESPMTALGCDIAQGGPDKTIIARRHGTWFNELITRAGSETPDGPTAAGLLVAHQRHGATISIDLGGGWGNSAYDHLRHNEEINVVGFVPSEAAVTRSMDGKYKFANKRAEAWWRLREGLDPSNEQKIALPPDRELLSDLCAPKWKLTPSGVLISPKDELRKELGRSPDKGDAVVICWHEGARQKLKSRNRAGRTQNLPTETNKGNQRYERIRRRSSGSRRHPAGRGARG
jgi:hypothetical protein